MATRVCPFMLKINESVLTGGGGIQAAPCIGEKCMAFATVGGGVGDCRRLLDVDMQNRIATALEMLVKHQLDLPEAASQPRVQ